MYLIDSSVILPCLWKTTKQAHLHYLAERAEEEAPAISVITRFEVFAGTTEEFLETNRLFLDAFQHTEVTSEIADAAGRLFYDWSKKGKRLESNDLLIGATAAVLGLLLITKNLRHFPYLEEIDRSVVEYASQKGKQTRETVYILKP